MTPLEFFLAGTMSAATVFLLAALGELVAEKSGMLNLSIEGMMAVSKVYLMPNLSMLFFQKLSSVDD